ncbi:Alpha/Beta hydrolase protein [Apodospora peruviana]|uniref:Alpha/Beta hydrolase protein n=1 Tax=Apodospora peruviana TaxID=516989 RepID=A0AAE0IIQ1_9PEZI|nr:Alpha/Beta hydrolase protein [Apodospora peruviana]
MALPSASPPGFTDHTFKLNSNEGEYDLDVRVWPADPPPSGPAPFIVWTHGGGFLAGKHYNPLPWLFPAFRTRGAHVVSHSYRLGPQVRLDEQISDCLSAIAWCRTNLPLILGPSKIDVNRYVLVGESAGGHLVTSMALHLPSPGPKAVIDVYGPIDLFTMGIFEPAGSFPENQVKGKEATEWSEDEHEFTEEELETFLGDRDPKNVITTALSWKEQEVISDDDLRKRWGAPGFEYSRRIRLQAELHIWRQSRRGPGGMLKGVIHPEGFADQREVEKFVESVSPLRVLLRRIKDGKGGGMVYPPTAILHGSGDFHVPIEQSYALAAALKGAGVPVVESYAEGEEHCFDFRFTSADVPGWNEYIQPIVDFVNVHMND